MSPREQITGALLVVAGTLLLCRLAAFVGWSWFWNWGRLCLVLPTLLIYGSWWFVRTKRPRSERAGETF